MRLPTATTLEDDDMLIEMALRGRLEVSAAQAVVSGAREAVSLTRTERIPVPSVGSAYEKDEAGTNFYGFTATVPVPVLNAGGPLLRRYKVEYQRSCLVLVQLRQRAMVQFQANLVKWHDAENLVRRTQAFIESVHEQTTRMEHLHAAGKTNVILITRDNVGNDAVT
jgi:outer membrane protein, heavy metal efflux system